METGMLRWAAATLTVRRLVATSFVVGATLGLVAAGGYRIAAPVEIFMSQFGLFVVVPTAVGYVASKASAAASAATGLLVVMCLTYPLPYADSVASWLLAAAVWTVFSLIAGPVFGLAGHALRTDDRRGALAAAGVLGMLGGEAIRMSQKGFAQGDLDLLSLSIGFDAAAVVVLGALIRPGRRGRVAVYAIPMAALGYAVTFVLR